MPAFNYTKVEPKGGGDFIKWEKVGDSFEGRYVSLQQGTYQNRITYHAIFVTPEGKTQKVNTPSVLLGRLQEEFQPGDQLYIVYTGDKRGRQPQPMKCFDIFKANGPATAAPAPVATLVPVAPATGSNYEQRAAKLREKVGPGADAMLSALAQFYTDPDERLKKLNETLKTLGVAD